MCESRRYALIFPALDVASAYPLNAITLGNNLMAAWASDLTPKVARFRRVRLFFRLLAAVPPIVGAFLANLACSPLYPVTVTHATYHARVRWGAAGAFLISNLDTILSFVGLFGFFVAFFGPAALYVAC